MPVRNDAFRAFLQREFICSGGSYQCAPIAEAMDCNRVSLNRCALGQQPFPVDWLPAIYEATKDIRFPRLAVGPRLVVTRWNLGRKKQPMDAIAEAQAILAKLVRLAGKKERGELLTREEKEAADQECAELIQSATDLHQALVED